MSKHKVRPITVPLSVVKYDGDLMTLDYKGNPYEVISLSGGGVVGPQGPQGIPGSAGPQGLQGPQGEEGLGLQIPTPILTMYKDDFGYKQLATSWHSNDTGFLDFQPKYYLFRYMGKQSYSNHRQRGFKHPANINGSGAINTAWWGGASCNASGGILPSRITEWVVDSNEGRWTNLDLNLDDWVYTVELPPCTLQYFRTRGSKTNNRHNAYFKIAIGIQIPSDNPTGCPIVFGPHSEVFSIKPKYFSHDVDSNKIYDGWAIKIGE